MALGLHARSGGESVGEAAKVAAVGPRCTPLIESDFLRWFMQGDMNERYGRNQDAVREPCNVVQALPCCCPTSKPSESKPSCDRDWLSCEAKYGGSTSERERDRWRYATEPRCFRAVPRLMTGSLRRSDGVCGLFSLSVSDAQLCARRHRPTSGSALNLSERENRLAATRAIGGSRKQRASACGAELLLTRQIESPSVRPSDSQPKG